MFDRVAQSPAPDAAIQRRWIVSRIVFVVGVAFVAALSVGLFFAAQLYAGLGGLALALLPIGETPPWWAYPVLAYVGYFALPAIVFLPILMPAAVTWRNPRRIVVFRRFNTRNESRALRRIATQHFGRFGHVFTLADQRIRRSWFVRIPALFGQLSFLHFRPRRVMNGRRLAKLTRLLEQRWRLNLNWLVSYRKIFPIESSDDYWQTCVGVLLDNADVIVMDISSFSTSMSWELEECHRRQLLDRTILLVDDETIEQGTAVLSRLPSGVSAAVESPPLTYRGTTVDAPAELRRKVADICAGHGVSQARASTFDMLMTAATTLALGLTLAAAGIALTAPYIWAHQTARYSPIKGQVLTAYFVTRDPALLSRIMSSDREWTLERLRRYLADDFRSHAAAVALRDLGDQRDVPLLVRFLANRPPPPRDDQQTWWSRSFGVTAIASRVEEESLVRLAQRLGKPALAPLVDALATAPRLPFDSQLYAEYIHVQAADGAGSVFEPLLAAPNQAGRFIAALELGPRGDTRTIPILLEMMRAPDVNRAAPEQILRKFEGVPGLRGASLDPYILENDSAAEHAARLAISAPDDAYLTAVVERVPSGAGRVLLNQLVAAAREGKPGAATRVHVLLARARAEWIQSLLSDADDAIKSKAAYARAEHGDPSIVPLLLRMSKQRGKCESILFITSDCNPYESDAVAALDLLRIRLHPPQRLDANTADMSGLGGATLTSLLHVTVASGDREALARLLQVLHPDERAEDKAALREFGERADAATLRLLVRGISRTSNPARASFLSAIGEGLGWREGIDFCAVARSEKRQDLVAAWEEAGQRCKS